MLEVISTHLAEIFWSIVGAGCLALATWGIKSIRTYMKQQQQEMEALKKGMMWIQHDKLYYLCQHYLEAGAIDVSSLENLEGLYKSYKSLGGNGTIEKLYNRIVLLRIVDNDGVQ